MLKTKNSSKTNFIVQQSIVKLRMTNLKNAAFEIFKWHNTSFLDIFTNDSIWTNTITCYLHRKFVFEYSICLLQILTAITTPKNNFIFQTHIFHIRKKIISNNSSFVKCKWNLPSLFAKFWPIELELALICGQSG